MKDVRRIGVTTILGREIVFYGSWEEPLFAVKDIANWVRHTNPSKMLTDAELSKDEEKEVFIEITYSYNNENRTRRQKTRMVTEEGLYEVLMTSKMPDAKELRREIKTYLKQIRKTGGTIEEGREEEFVSKYFPSFSDEVQLAMVQDLLKTNKKLKPKADYHDEVLKPKYLKTTTDVAKDLGMSAQKLNKILHKKKIIYPKRVNGKIRGWYLYSKYEHMIPEYADYHITQYNQMLKWTEKGRKWIVELLKED